MTEPEIARAFRRSALRRTPQRYAVLEYLVRHPVHATADEIYRALNGADPRASRATVYNNLHALARAGLIREVPVEGKAARFDVNLERHHHFICESCGGIGDIPWFEAVASPPANLLGPRHVTHYEVIFRGLCEACSAGPAQRRPRRPGLAGAK